MLKSMTGFGRTLISNNICELKIEIKSVNSKYSDINIRLPRTISFLEIPIRSIVVEKMLRGKIDLFIEARFHKPIQIPILNRQAYIAAMNTLEQMKTLGGISGDIKLEHLLTFSDLVEYTTASAIDSMEDMIKDAVKECLDLVDQMRTAEAMNLRRSIIMHLAEIDDLARKVDDAKNEVFLYWMERFKARTKEFAANIDDSRIIQEASLYAEKADIKEELARIRSHQAQFKNIMDIEYPCGKKLDFLCQEMYREWNTIASKSSNAGIIGSVIEAKAAVDSIREQIQNVV